MASSRVIRITILLVMIGMILAWAPMTCHAQTANVVLYATLYSDGSIEIKGIEKFNVNESSGSYYLQNITFYNNQTINYLKNVGYFHLQPFEHVTPITGKMDLMTINRKGETIGNSTYIIENPNRTLIGTTNYRVYKNGTSWVMWSHITL